jgi:hypothetical protein
MADKNLIAHRRPEKGGERTGVARYCFVARYGNAEEAERAAPPVRKIAEGLAFLNDAWQRVRHDSDYPPSARLGFLRFLASPSLGDPAAAPVLAKLSFGYADEELLRERIRMGELPDLSPCLPDAIPEIDGPMNAVCDVLPDMTENFELRVLGRRLVLSDTVWHLTSWDRLEELVRKHTGPEQTAWKRLDSPQSLRALLSRERR